MTADIMPPLQPSFSLAEQAFRDAENWDEQNLVEEYLGLCSAADNQIRNYLRTHPTDLTAACRFFAARTEWSRDAWMQADHDQRIHMIEDQMGIMQHISFCQSRRNAKIQQIIRDGKNFIEELRWIRNAGLFDRGDESVWDREAYLW